jgi:diguanylate cyclase (GGDEF)-like protein/PAS domain S-box-containing protein
MQQNIGIRTCAAGIERLARAGSTDSEEITAILVDLFLPDSQEIETFDRLFRAGPHIPIPILSAPEHEDIAQFPMQHGGQDYLLKDHIESNWLPKAVSSMVGRASIAEALFDEKERAQVTLNSIGDAVMVSDVLGKVTYLNVAAERLTGWSLTEATGRSLEDVFQIVDASTRATLDNPLVRAFRENKAVVLSANCVLVRRDGLEAGIEDSAAPIHDRRGQVTGAVMVFHDVSTTRASSLRMSHLAQHDSLTDLPNRSLLSDRLDQAITLAYRRRRRLAVLFLDVDIFKDVNDSLRHDVGNLLLQSIARRLLACVRSPDTVSRQGGDEFVILLSDVTHAADAAVAAAKVLRTLTPSHVIHQHDLHVTASIGIVIYPEDGMDCKTLLKHADFAMYHAKNAGCNNYQFFEREMNMRALERLSLEGDLRRAIASDEFMLHYQPKVNPKTGAITAVDALIRWRHPHRGLIPAADFMSAAEGCGAIVTTDQWVLREASQQARAWQSEWLAAAVNGYQHLRSRTT